MTTIKGTGGPRLPGSVEETPATQKTEVVTAKPAAIEPGLAPAELRELILGGVSAAAAPAPASESSFSDEAVAAFSALVDRLTEPAAGAGGKFALDGLTADVKPAELDREWQVHEPALRLALDSDDRASSQREILEKFQRLLRKG